MAERWAVASGNWSNTATWNGGTLPGTGDDVYSNGFQVTVDIDVTVLSYRNGAGTTAVAGGDFRFNTTRTLVGNVINGTNAGACMQILSNTGSLTLTGNVTAGPGQGINIGGANVGQVTINGNITGGSSGTAHGINVTNGYGNTITVNGDLIGGTGSGVSAISTAATFGGLIVNGNLISGSAGRALTNGSAATGNVTINGNITATGTGEGYYSTATHNATVNGKVMGGLGTGIVWNAVGTLTVNRPGQVAVEGSDQAAGSGDYGISTSGNNAVTVINGHVLGGSNGTSCHGIHIPTSFNALTVNGDVTGGGGSSGIGINMGANHPVQSVTVTGTVKGGTGPGANGISLGSSQHVVLNIVEGNSYGNGTVVNPCYAVNSSGNNPNVRCKQIKYGTHGMSPVNGRITLIDETANNLANVSRYPDNTILVYRQTSFAADFPALADVRLNTTFDNGAKIGTCAIPPASSVIAGALVDNTVGTGVFTADNFRDAIGMDAADLDLQLADAVTACEELQTSADALLLAVDGIEPALSGLVKQVHNFDMLANIADTVPKISLRNAVRMGFNFAMTDTLATVYKEDGTTEAWTADIQLDGKAIRELKVN